ncbi:unnamed protein product [Clonostachys rhizophaga]|uniref:DDHD domain-containing protein n=1 Tax=Clonostachys rhizophaga TaxID=160324 RepID=A0A9N9YDW5_9HYPO|nr:unnamed protein product [Clonostachys rhizophaga]
MARDRENSESMAAGHTYGSKCRLAPVSRTDNEDGMPPIEAQFFYASIIPIDDPLSTSSTAAGSEPKSSKLPLRPFARGDNNALEKAWLALQTEEDRKDHELARKGRKHIASGPYAGSARRESLVQTIALKHWQKHGSNFEPLAPSLPVDASFTSQADSLCCAELAVDVTAELEGNFCSLARVGNPDLKIEHVLRDVMEAIIRISQSTHAAIDSKPDAISRPRASSLAQTNRNPPSPSTDHKVRSNTDARNNADPRENLIENARDHETRYRSGSQVTNRSSRPQTPAEKIIPSRPPVLDDGISGKPFVRVGSVEAHSPKIGSSLPKSESLALGSSPGGTQLPVSVREQSLGHVESFEDSKSSNATNTKYSKNPVDVAVGVSRLHMVTLPALQMKPIYWSPVNDLATVTRSTWFYRDTMLPIPPTVANQLEAGFHELRPWTDTWSDEIRCAIDVGPLGEEKVSHRLWPETTGASKAASESYPTPPPISSNPYCAARCFRGDAAAEGSIEPLKKEAELEDPSMAPIRPFAQYHIIYKNATEAFMLKPSLKPSAYYGRKPVSKIMKGLTVGIPVVRGFDRNKWDRIHRKKQTPNEPGVSAASESHENQGHDVCPACKVDKERGQVKDLLLVAHGIGQKFAERVESFHFTHAINGFRRAINIELGNPIVHQILPEGHNGIMVLPLNWRMGLSFEDGGPMTDEDQAEQAPESFGLKDIEPPTIPAVRSMISDVMFDIPFYMSHHKGKMIKALVSEANRVYRLWCRNNPGFSENGRVHLIGHSLGSAMALEILSRQPTYVPPLNLSQAEPETGFFEFDTRNLFLAGSPAGFFLLLERGALVPRRGRRKAGIEPGDAEASDVVGEAGTFGCLAVDNIYNILAKEDPIAYLLNGSVDPNYASSLKVAHVPSATPSFFQSMGDAVRHVILGVAPAPNPLALDQALDRPPTFRLPSQLELEVHDFTREELAEKKAYLLNDNGQIDYYLRSGGGPLEIQYLNMLSAHTSYWTNQDFIRMICVEVGRKPGRKNTLPAMRAMKAKKRVIPNTGSH